MHTFLDKPLVLSLNRSWQVIGHRTVKQALVALTGGDATAAAALPPALGLDIAYAPLPSGSAEFPLGPTAKKNLDAPGNQTGAAAPTVNCEPGTVNCGPAAAYDFTRPLHMTPLPWADWLKLPIRDYDLIIHTPRQAIRVPTVIIATNYARMPMRTPRLTRDAIYARDAGVCQYTGEHVGHRDGNLDHVVPRSRGGRDTFENLVWAKREINTLKANRLPHEAGLRLLRRPQPPRPLPISALIREARHPDWRHFLTA